MPIDDRTPNRSYQLPNAGNLLVDDVARLRAALQAIDADVYARYTKTEVDQLITNLIAGAPGALDTLNELAAALGDDANFATTVANQLALKANAADVYSKAQSDARYVQGQVQTEMVFVATANQSVFTLTTPIINKPSALLTVDGVVQPSSEYSLNMAGTQLTLSEGVPSGTIVRVLALGVAAEGAPADDTVTTPKLRDAAVTAAKIADGAVGTPELADGAVTAAKLAAGTALAPYSVTVTATSKTLADRERCTVTAAGQTITLPASPAAGAEVSITAAGSFTNTTVARNGQLIMGLAEDMMIDRSNVTVTLYYVDATRGWRIL